MKTETHVSCLCILGLILCGLSCPFFLEAATVTWVGGSGDWNTTSNWNTGSLPGTNDDVVIGSGPAITVTHSANSHIVRSIQSQQLFRLSGGSLAVANTIQIKIGRASCRERV